MKGLLIKDFFCLKRQLFTFICICVGVLLVSVLVLISSEHGNLANGFHNMIADGDLTAERVATLMQYCMIFVLLIPMAFTENVANVFLDDRNASFQKLAGALPISVAKRVASRYITQLYHGRVSDGYDHYLCTVKADEVYGVCRFFRRNCELRILYDHLSGTVYSI